MQLLGFDDIRDEFVGRQSEIDMFRRATLAPGGPKLIVYHGVGGIGKTWLLSRLAEEARGERFRCAVVDFRSMRYDYLSVLTSISDQINMTVSSAFNSELVRYRTILESRYIPVALGGDSRDTSKPFTGTVADLIGGGLAGLRVGGLTDIFDAMRRDLENAFLQAVEEGTHGRTPVALLFDTVEYLQDSEMDRWLLEFCLKLAAESVVCVLAGRNRVRTSREFRARLRQFEVGYFTHDEVGYYLRTRRQLAQLRPEVIDGLFELTRGHPLCVGLAGDLLVDIEQRHDQIPRELSNVARELSEAMVSEFLTERILAREAPETVYALMAAAVTRRFDASTLAEIGRCPNSHALIERMSHFSFVVRAAGSGYGLHDIIRELLVLKWHRDNYQGFLEANLRAVAFFERLANWQSRPSPNSQMNLQRLYHLLIVDENRGMALFEELYRFAEARQQREYCESLVKEVASYSDYLQSVRDVAPRN